MVSKHEWFYCPHCGKGYYLPLKWIERRTKPFTCSKCHQVIETFDKVRKVRTNIYGTPIPVDACKAPLGYECEYLIFYADGKWKGHSKCESPDGECCKNQEDFDGFLGYDPKMEVPE